MIRILPSIASASPLFFGNTLDALCGCDMLHVDIEDGNFIPNITFGMKTVRAIADYTDMSLDIHIMATDPMQYLPQLLALPTVKSVAVHVESLPYPLTALNAIRSAGRRAGLAVNFATPLCVLTPFADELDYILVMSSEADGRDQSFRPSSLPRIRQAHALMNGHGGVTVDGGITNAALLKDVCRAGADCVVMGRAIVGSDNPLQALSLYQSSVQDLDKQ